MEGIRMSECQFYVDEVKRTIVCVIPHTKYWLEEFMNDNFFWKEIVMEFGLTVPFKEQMLLPNSFTGKAVCSEEDEWNEDLGRLIAFSRAKDKFYKSFFKRANLFVQMLDGHLNDIITIFNNLGDGLEKKKGILEAKIEKIINKEIEGTEEKVE